MQTTSATFAPYADARYCDIRVSFRLVDKTAAADATAAATGHDADISQLAQTYDGTEGMSAKWATPETHGWPLDGSCAILPDSVDGIQTGMWSAVSGADGTFTADPTLTFTFTGNHSSVGFTVMFDWIYPKTMTATAYDSTDAVIDTKTVTVTSQKYVVEMPVENYRKIVLSFSETQLPYQRVRISEFVFGIVQEYDKTNTTQATILYEVSPRSENQPTNQLTITIDNTDHAYNMRSPNSLYAYLQQGQPLDAEIGIGSEYVSMGRFYFAKSEAKDASMTAQITAYDWFYRMDKSLYRFGVEGTDTVSNLIDAVLTDANIGLTANIPAAIGSRVIGSCIPIVTHREAIRLIAQAARCVAFINRDDELELADLTAGTAADTLDGSNMANYPEVSVADRVNTVDVTVNVLYIRSFDAEDLYKGIIAITGTQDVWVTYSSPGRSPNAAVTGGTLNSAAYYLCGALLNITAAGDATIVITGTALNACESTYTASDLDPNEIPQPLQINNPLITSTAAAATVASWALAISRLTYPVVYRGNPALELADTVTIEDAYGTDGDAVIVKQQFNFGGALSCDIEAVG